MPKSRAAGASGRWLGVARCGMHVNASATRPTARRIAEARRYSRSTHDAGRGEAPLQTPLRSSIQESGDASDDEGAPRRRAAGYRAAHGRGAAGLLSGPARVHGNRGWGAMDYTKHSVRGIRARWRRSQHSRARAYDALFEAAGGKPRRAVLRDGSGARVIGEARRSRRRRVTCRGTVARRRKGRMGSPRNGQLGSTWSGSGRQLQVAAEEGDSSGSRHPA